MRERAAALVALMIVVVAIVAGMALRRGPGAETPEDAVYALFDAGRDGDVDRYLACFSGELRDRLAADCREAGNDAFGAALRDRARPITGLALTRPYPDQDSETEQILRVELVFPDRNERQDFRLVRHRSRWTVVEISRSDAVTMPIPYGTPVMPEPPPGDEPQPGPR